MAFPTPVNGQITDAVDEANPKVLGDAPAIAMGNLMVATSQALSNAAHNAVNAQQQSYVTSQAATTQGVSTLLSVDTATVGVGPAAEMARQMQAVAVASPAPNTAFTAVPNAAMAPQALDFADKLEAGGAAHWANAVREVMAAFTDALDGLQHLNQESNMAVLRQAALAATLVRMISAPEKLDEYEKMIEVIKAL